MVCSLYHWNVAYALRSLCVLYDYVVSVIRAVLHHFYALPAGHLCVTLIDYNVVLTLSCILLRILVLRVSLKYFCLSSLLSPSQVYDWKVVMYWKTYMVPRVMKLPLISII